MTATGLTTALRETLAVFRTAEPGTPFTTSEVTDELDVGHRSTYDRLNRLAESGYLETKEVGARGRVWWQRPTSRQPLVDAIDPHETEDDAAATLGRLLEEIPDLVYRRRNGPEGPMAFASDAATGIVGYEPAALEMGAVDWWADVVVPADYDRVTTEIRDQLRDDRTFDVEYRVRTADGEVRWVYDRGRVVSEGLREPGVEGIVRDVTARKRAEGELADQRTHSGRLTERQRAAVEAAYEAGFYESPRQRTGEDVAETLGVSGATFHQHLREAHRKIVGRFLS